MFIRICIPIHKPMVDLLFRAVEDISCQTILSTGNKLEVVIVANRDATRKRPEFLDNYSFPIYYAFFDNIFTAAEARNLAISIKTGQSPYQFFMFHDYDDAFLHNKVIENLISPFLNNDGNTGISISDVSFGFEDGNRACNTYLEVSGKNIHPNLFIEKFIETGFFPFQSSMFVKSIAFKIGLFPNTQSLEDRVFCVKYLKHIESLGLYASYIHDKTVLYVQHRDSLSSINSRSHVKHKILNTVRDWYTSHQDVNILYQLVENTK